MVVAKCCHGTSLKWSRYRDKGGTDNGSLTDMAAVYLNIYHATLNLVLFQGQKKVL